MATLRYYGNPRHGLIEVLQGQVVAWPPYTETRTLVETIGQEEIWLETRLSGNTYADWEEYADLAMFGALNAFHDGKSTAAHSIYQAAMQMWNGIGFNDKAYRADGLYATYKPALALYTAEVLGEPRNLAILDALLAKQAPPGVTCVGIPCAGGFYTLYDAQGMPQGDTNTETTAYALLALSRQP